MFSSIDELPTEVKNSLDEDDARTYLETYNSYDPKTKEEIAEAKKKAWESCKTLPSSFSFDIVASVEDVDSDGELITIDSLKNQMDKFIEQGGVVQSEHGDYRTAVIWDYDDYVDPETGYPGILVHGNVFGGRGENSEYLKARQDFVNGRNSLSIAGDASVEGYECDGERCFVRRNIMQLMEISLVENPANPYAKLIWYNDKAIVKSKDSTNLKVKTVGIHKSYNECDLELLRKNLKGFRTKLTSQGIEVDSHDIGEVQKRIKGVGIITNLGPCIVVDSKKRVLEDEFKKSFKRGECDENGILTDKVVKGRFVELFNREMIVEKNGRWGFDGSILR